MIPSKFCYPFQLISFQGAHDQWANRTNLPTSPMCSLARSTHNRPWYFSYFSVSHLQSPGTVWSSTIINLFSLSNNTRSGHLAVHCQFSLCGPVIDAGHSIYFSLKHSNMNGGWSSSYQTQKCSNTGVEELHCDDQCKA